MDFIKMIIKLQILKIYNLQILKNIKKYSINQDSLKCK